MGSRVGSGIRVGIEGEVGQFAVQRVAVRGQIVQHLLAVGALQQRPALVAGQAFQLRGHADPQVDHEAAPGDQCTVAGIQHRAATGGDQLAVALQHAGQGFAFMAAEAGFAGVLEDGRDAGAGGIDDGLVDIDEVQREALGQATADAGFASAHRADQDQVRSRIHAL